MGEQSSSLVLFVESESWSTRFGLFTSPLALCVAVSLLILAVLGIRRVFTHYTRQPPDTTKIVKDWYGLANTPLFKKRPDRVISVKDAAIWVRLPRLQAKYYVFYIDEAMLKGFVEVKGELVATIAVVDDGFLITRMVDGEEDISFENRGDFFTHFEHLVEEILGPVVTSAAKPRFPLRFSLPVLCP
ncbi:hypothetical protein DICA0_A06942 [Diutina catenulata]